VLALLLDGADSVLLWPALALWLELLPIAADDDGWEAAAWSELVAAPVTPPVVLIDADEPLEQVSETLVTLVSVITLPEVELAEVAPLLDWEFADELLPASEPLICTCCPMWLCSWLVSPWTW
jgi:hypothetical protein